jgi:hypothetical protein
MANPTTVNPNADDVIGGSITLQGDTAAWKCVDEASQDDNTTAIINNGAANAVQSATFSVPSPAIPAGATAIQCVVHGWFDAGALSSRAEVSVKSGTSLTYSTPYYPTSSYTETTLTVTLDPATGAAWGVTAANAAKIGVRMTNGSPTLYRVFCTQVYAVWTWTDPPVAFFPRPSFM